METFIACPQCQLQLRITEQHAGEPIRCTGCATRFLAPALAGPLNSPPARSEPNAGESDRENPYRAPVVPIDFTSRTRHDEARGGGNGTHERTFRLVVKRDREKRLKGSYKAQLVPGGLELRQGKNDPTFLPVKSAELKKIGGGFSVATDGRDVTLEIKQQNVFAERCTRDLVAFFNGQQPEFTLANYLIPRSLMISAYAPLALTALALLGGFLGGGGLGGGILGGIVGAAVGRNLGIIRNEQWSVEKRLSVSIAVTAIGAAVMLLLIVAMFLVGLAIQASQ
jgi:hypothetical protein